MDGHLWLGKDIFDSIWAKGGGQLSTGFGVRLNYLVVSVKIWGEFQLLRQRTDLYSNRNFGGLWWRGYLAFTLFFFLTPVHFLLCVYVHPCMCMYIWVPVEASRRHWISWLELLAVMRCLTWAFGTAVGSCVRVAHVLSCQAIPPAQAFTLAIPLTPLTMPTDVWSTSLKGL